MLLDAFGTRLDPAALRAELATFGVPLQLVAHDDGLTLTLDADLRSDAASRAVTAVRGAFSPLLPVRVHAAPLPPGVSLEDRTTPRHVIALAEIVRPPSGLDEALHSLLDRLGVPTGPAVTADVTPPPTDDAELGGRLAGLAAAWAAALGARGVATGGLSWLDAGLRLTAGPQLLAWQRPGGATGVRPALILAASTSPSALSWLVAALQDPPDLPELPVLLDGLVWSVARRPTLAAPPDPSPIVVDPDRCTACGLCAAICPTGFLDDHGRPVVAPEPPGCIRCQDCVEACPVDALRPSHADDAAMRGELPSIREGWLARLRGAPGPAEPAPFPPAWMMPKADPPRVVLGLAIMTQQEHAAALIVDGRLVGAVEEEKLVRVRHHGWRPRSGPSYRNLGVDPTITLEQVLCRRSIRVLLSEAGLTLDDVDLIAINGLPSRYRRALPVLDAERPVPVLRSGRLVHIPHHLAHAASAWRLSGLPAAWVLTVDGRGDRETAALFRADAGGIRPVRTLLSLTDRSIGGVYETVTRLLGFGSHGQGSVMALAALGTPSDALAPWLSARSWEDVSIHEGGIAEAFTALRRGPDDPLTDAHRDLAASLQRALEQTLLTLVRDGAGEHPDALCLAGGVALNCKANEVLRTELTIPQVWAQPGANDAGTAVGAAAEAWAQAGGGPLVPMETASLGPAFDDDALQRALDAAGLRWERPDDIAQVTAERLAQGEVVCWFQDRLEFGPRALGARSILADPRDARLHARVNRMKDREPWRPFAPSVLAGHEADWFVAAHDSRFMLFTQDVLPDRRAAVPVITHDDGSSRTQVVHPHTHPLYHRMITAFYALTGVPMVVDTSFNRRGEPIVCRPEEAIEAFAALGADGLAIGPFFVRQGDRLPKAAPAADAALATLPGGRRLMLRVTTRCELDCGHCTLRDHLHHGEEPDAAALIAALARGREAGCDELVLMRGEPLLRADHLTLLQRARRMGYRFVQLQTNGRALADPQRVRALRQAGVDALEVMLLGADAAVHDRIARFDGAFRDTVAGLQQAVRAGFDVLVTVPVLRRNGVHLARIMSLLHKLGVRRVQLSFPRPVETPNGVPTEELLRLAPAAAFAARAARHADKLGLSVSTEGFPLCRLEPWLHGTPDATVDFNRHRIDDMGIVHDGFQGVRGALRPEGPACALCTLRDRCPRTWGLYLELFGAGELITR